MRIVILGAPAGVPSARRAAMFLAALASRLCTAPQLQVHCLIPSLLKPFSPTLAHEEHVWIGCASFTSSKTTPACWLLYSNTVLNMAQPASSVLLAIWVLTSFVLPTSPTKMAALFFTSVLLNWCRPSLRWFLILAWMARTRPFFLARRAVASAFSWRSRPRSPAG